MGLAEGPRTLAEALVALSTAASEGEARALAEKRGSFTNTKGRVQKFMQAIQPPGEARAEWDFLHDLVYNVTGKNGFLTIEGLFNEMAKDVSAFNGLTWASLGDTGVTVKI